LKKIPSLDLFVVLIDLLLKLLFFETAIDSNLLFALLILKYKFLILSFIFSFELEFVSIVFMGAIFAVEIDISYPLVGYTFHFEILIFNH